MKLLDFLKTNHIKVPEFAKACGYNTNTVRCWVYGTRRPPIEALYRIIVQSGYNVTLEDFRDDPAPAWTPQKKLATTIKHVIGGLDTTTMRKHERKKYFDDIDLL